jgi:uncharacterized protein involved in exopolysaccharide biosynthesis
MTKHGSATQEQEISDLVGVAETQEVEESGAVDLVSAVSKLRLIWDHRKIVIRSTLAGLVVATLVAFSIPKRFNSTTRLMPPDTQSSSGLAMMAARSGQLGGLGALAGEALGMKSSGALFVGILRSRTVEERLVERFQLGRVYGIRLSEDACKKLEGDTSISEDRKNGIITITVTDHDPRRAAALAGAYVEELDRLVAQLSTSAAHRERVFLEERLTAVKKDLDAASEQFGQFASKNTAIDIQAQGRAMVDAAARLQGELIAAQSELEMLKQIYTESNVRVRATQARISELQRQLQKMGGEQTTTGRNATQSADPLYPSIRELPLLGVTYADLLRRTKIEETVYEILTQQYELAKVQEVKETPSVKVLDPATAPERKSFPPRLVIMSLGTFLSLAFAVVWVLGNAHWEETDPQDPRKLLAIEVLQAAKGRMASLSQNGSGLGAFGRKFWSRVSGRHQQPDEHK